MQKTITNLAQAYLNHFCFSSEKERLRRLLKTDKVKMLIFKLFLFFNLLGILIFGVTASLKSPKPKTQNKEEEMNSEVTKFMTFFQVIPDVLTNGPKEFLKVTFDSGVFADKGVELKPAQVKNPPQVAWQAEAGVYYTLVMTDPDATSRSEPTKREWKHWLVGNILKNDISKADVLSAYIGAGPPEGTGLHRYVFLVYKQPGKLTFDEETLTKTSTKGRENFSTQKFAEKYKLGIPIAGNFFQAQYDDYVLELYKQFTS